jgi:hypothetical protein
MKPQDIFFLITVCFLLYKRKPVLFIWAGLFFLLLAVPLFVTQIFFTAERLTWYALGVFFIGTVFLMIDTKRD